MTENVKQFIKALVAEVRDEAIQSCDNLLRSLDNDHMSVIAKRWKRAKESGDYDRFLAMVIADTVDHTIFQLLRSIDETSLPLQLHGADLSVEGEGEMAGIYVSEWRENMSKERNYNDFADL